MEQINKIEGMIIGIIKYIHPLFCLSYFQANKSRGRLFLKGGRMMRPSTWAINIQVSTQGES